MAGQLIDPTQAPLAPSLTVAQPLNDVQLVALVAGQLRSGVFSGDPELVVDEAVEIVAHSLVAVRAGALQVRVAELARLALEAEREQAEAAGVQPPTPEVRLYMPPDEGHTGEHPGPFNTPGHVPA